MLTPLVVLFDWYDTLLNTQGCFNDEIMEILLKKMGKEVEKKDINLHTKRKEYLISLFGDKWKKVNSLYESKLENLCFLNKSQLNEGALDLLDFLTSKGVYLGIVSNKKGDKLRQEVEKMGLKKYFEEVIGAGDSMSNKPSPDPILKALSLMKISPGKRIFFIGDSSSDIESAIRAECLPIAYNNKNVSSDILSFSNFYEIKEFISGLFG